MGRERTPPVKKVLVTGGSGFIGTVLVGDLIEAAHDVLSIDVRPPMDPEHAGIFRQVNILDKRLMVQTAKDYAPTDVIHLAARTDFDQKEGLSGYAANTTGVENLIAAIASQPTVGRAVFASTKLVHAGPDAPTSDEDYRTDTVYAQSKVVSEQFVRQSSRLACDWCIVRPASIWGPWFGTPYRGFFLSIAKGWYCHPGRCDPPKSFGYVGNVVFQIQKLLDAPSGKIHKQTFYLSDYQATSIRTWADMISYKLRGKKNRTVPGPLAGLAALCGDVLKACGASNPPITSFRLKNMRKDTSCIPLDNTREITGPLPYTLEQGVDETIDWLRNAGLIK